MESRVFLDEIVPAKEGGPGTAAGTRAAERGEVGQVVLPAQNAPTAVVLTVEHFGQPIRNEREHDH